MSRILGAFALVFAFVLGAVSASAQDYYGNPVAARRRLCRRLWWWQLRHHQ